MLNNLDFHKPVMIEEVKHYLNIQPGLNYIDATFGAGGYTQAILEQGGNVIAFDQDSNVLKFVEKIKNEYGNKFNFVNENFENIDEVKNLFPNKKISGIVFDLGVSSMQLDEEERGFSFNSNGPLDMRMGGNGITAEEYINKVNEKELSEVLQEYGGEKMHKSVAKAIVQARLVKKIETPLELANIIRKVVRRSRVNPIDPATRSFQAIRIKINRELEVFETALKKSLNLVTKLGRVVVVSFHSLEDKIAKTLFREFSGYHTENQNKYFTMLTKKVIEATREETKFNPRSRSAKLRAIEKVGEIA